MNEYNYYMIYLTRKITEMKVKRLERTPALNTTYIYTLILNILASLPSRSYKPVPFVRKH